MAWKSSGLFPRVTSSTDPLAEVSKALHKLGTGGCEARSSSRSDQLLALPILAMVKIMAMSGRIHGDQNGGLVSLARVRQ